MCLFQIGHFQGLNRQHCYCRHIFIFHFAAQAIAAMPKRVKNGMKAAGKNPDTDLVEVMEIPDHPWFIGVQYHPEYKSTVRNPHPLFVSFVAAVLKEKD